MYKRTMEPVVFESSTFKNRFKYVDIVIMFILGIVFNAWIIYQNVLFSIHYESVKVQNRTIFVLKENHEHPKEFILGYPFCLILLICFTIPYTMLVVFTIFIIFK